MSQQQDKRNGITSMGPTDHDNQSSRSSSVSSVQPGVSNLIKIYSEASTSQPQRNENVVPTNKHNELVKIFEQASNKNPRQQPNYRRTSSSPAEIKQPIQAREEITWDNVTHG